MKLYVLGSNSKGNGYILEGKSQTLLLEAGLPLKDVKEALKFDLSRVVGGVVSHLHGDHSKYAKLVYKTSGFDSSQLVYNSSKSEFTEDSMQRAFAANDIHIPYCISSLIFV